MKRIMVVLNKFDYIFILIATLGVIFILQQIFISQNVPTMTDRVTVVVNVPLPQNVLENSSFEGITKLYFDQSRQPSEVTKIEKVAGGVNIYFTGPGESNGNQVFAGRAINVNDRIKVTGGLSGDGFVVKVEKNNG